VLVAETETEGVIKEEGLGDREGLAVFEAHSDTAGDALVDGEARLLALLDGEPLPEGVKEAEDEVLGETVLSTVTVAVELAGAVVGMGEIVTRAEGDSVRETVVEELLETWGEEEMEGEVMPVRDTRALEVAEVLTAALADAEGQGVVTADWEGERETTAEAEGEAASLGKLEVVGLVETRGEVEKAPVSEGAGETE